MTGYWWWYWRSSCKSLGIPRCSRSCRTYTPDTVQAMSEKSDVRLALFILTSVPGPKGTSQSYNLMKVERLAGADQIEAITYKI